MKFQNIAGEVSLDFINTLDNRPDPARQQELLLSYRDLVDWATQAGVITAAQRASLLRQAADRPHSAQNVLRDAIRLRECLYRLFTNVIEKHRPSEADLRTFNGYLGEAFSYLLLRPTAYGYRLQWMEDQLRLESTLWSIASAASALLTATDSQYIRRCDSPTCRWFFLDRSKNHTRRWCDMKLCGNRAKARTFYRQHRR